MLDNLDLYIELLQILNNKSSTAQELLSQSSLAMDLNSVLNVLNDHIDGNRVSMAMGVYSITEAGKTTLKPVLESQANNYQAIHTYTIENPELSETLEWTENNDGTVTIVNQSGTIVLNINEQEQLLELLKALDLK